MSSSNRVDRGPRPETFSRVGSPLRPSYGLWHPSPISPSRPGHPSSTIDGPPSLTRPFFSHGKEDVYPDCRDVRGASLVSCLCQSYLFFGSGNDCRGGCSTPRGEKVGICRAGRGGPPTHVLYVSTHVPRAVSRPEAPRPLTVGGPTLFPRPRGPDPPEALRSSSTKGGRLRRRCYRRTRPRVGRNRDPSGQKSLLMWRVVRNVAGGPGTLRAPHGTLKDLRDQDGPLVPATGSALRGIPLPTSVTPARGPPDVPLVRGGLTRQGHESDTTLRWHRSRDGVCRGQDLRGGRDASFGERVTPHARERAEGPRARWGCGLVGPVSEGPPRGVRDGSPRRPEDTSPTVTTSSGLQEDLRQEDV